MHCEEAQALLDAYVDRELDVVHDIAMATHLQACRTCAQQHEALEALHTALQAKGTYFTPRAQLHRRIHSALRRAARPTRLRPSYVALAAVLVLVIGSVVWWRWWSINAAVT